MMISTHATEDDPAVWAPIHAMRILALIGPAEAAEPLLECMEWDDDWFEELAGVYGRIGPAAIPLLRGYLYDTEHTTFRAWPRRRCVDGDCAVASGCARRGGVLAHRVPGPAGSRRRCR